MGWPDATWEPEIFLQNENGQDVIPLFVILYMYIFFFLLISLLSLSFCVCLLAFFSARDLVFISTFMLLCLELQKKKKLKDYKRVCQQ